MGATKAEALEMAADALNLDLSERVRNREYLPLPGKGSPRVSPSAQVAAKATKYVEKREAAAIIASPFSAFTAAADDAARALSRPAPRSAARLPVL